MTTPDDSPPFQSDADAPQKRRRFAPRRSRSAALQAESPANEAEAQTIDPALSDTPGVGAEATPDNRAEATLPQPTDAGAETLITHDGVAAPPEDAGRAAPVINADAPRPKWGRRAAAASGNNPSTVPSAAPAATANTEPVREASVAAPEAPVADGPIAGDTPPAAPSSGRRRSRAKQPPAGATAHEPAGTVGSADNQLLTEQTSEPENTGKRRPSRRSRMATPTPVVEATTVAEEAPSVTEATEPDPAPVAEAEAPRRNARSRRGSAGRRMNAPAPAPDAALQEPAQQETTFLAGSAPVSDDAGTPAAQTLIDPAASQPDVLHTGDEAGVPAAAQALVADAFLPAPDEASSSPDTLDAEQDATPDVDDHGTASFEDGQREGEASSGLYSAVGSSLEAQASAQPSASTDVPEEAAPGTADELPADLVAGLDADIDRDDLLARAIRALFPTSADSDEADGGFGAPYDAHESDTAAIDDAEDDLAALAALDGVGEGEDGDLGEPLEGEDAAEAARRRGRRGRRGGRGRRRNGLVAVADPGEATTEVTDSEVAETAAAPSETVGGEPPIELFQPEVTPRPTRNWRDRGPRRQWGRTFSRETDTVRMPPPKPSNGARPGPIPQAMPPLAAVAEPQIVVPQSVPLVLPDLGLDEPLEPGETRTERLLLAQTRLMQAMMEQQARQIEVLTASVAGLRQSVQQLGNARGYLPRTGIFVDAPNVCYAADNARVQIDYGRMLKYLSRDRELVHALSYAPITDDVHEGIRYETQRFVAPFLRAGYKMITKPLKRFPDGSAKGNFDIELAVDIVTMSDRLDIVVLVSGDSDFEPMIELIQGRGVRVEVVAFASNVSTELVNVADVFIDIHQHLEHMRAL